MRRYCLSPITGNGTDNSPYRASVGDATGTNSSFVIPTDNQGAPKYLVAFGMVGTTNLPGVLQVSNSFVFPDYPLDGRMDGMDSVTRAAMIQSVQAFILTNTPSTVHIATINDDANSFRDVLTYILHQFDANANLNGIDAQEPS